MKYKYKIEQNIDVLKAQAKIKTDVELSKITEVSRPTINKISDPTQVESLTLKNLIKLAGALNCKKLSDLIDVIFEEE